MELKIDNWQLIILFCFFVRRALLVVRTEFEKLETGGHRLLVARGGVVAPFANGALHDG